MALGTFLITYYVSRYGTGAVAAYGAALRIEQVALIPTIGLNIALAALVGQNNGAGKMDRVLQSYRTSLALDLVVMVAVLTPVLLFARTIMRQFTADPEVTRIGMSYLYIQALTFYSYILLHQSNSVLQGLKKPGMILWAGIYSQIPAPLLVFSLLSGPLGLGVRGIWWGLVVVNWSAAPFVFWYTSRQLRLCVSAAAAPADAAPVAPDPSRA